MYVARALSALWNRQIDAAARWARQALGVLPPSELPWRGFSLGFVGSDELRSGNLNVARHVLIEALACDGQNPHALRAHRLLLGDVCAGQGELRQAAELYRQVLADAGNDLDDRAKALLGLAQIDYERNLLDDAERAALTALELGRERSDDLHQLQADLILACVAQARGDWEHAHRRLATWQARLLPQRSALRLREVLAWQARLDLQRDNLVAAERWQSNRALYPADLSPIQQEQEALIEARLDLLRGDPQAVPLRIDRYLTAARAAGRIIHVYRMELALALAYAALDREEAALHLLRGVLARAEVEGFRRLVLDEGPPLTALVRALAPTLRDSSLRQYAHTLLHEAALEQVEIAALSPQEQRVLALLAADRSNAEIAAELVVSVNTVKTQLKSIYRKLNATSRQDACAVARRLDLV